LCNNNVTDSGALALAQNSTLTVLLLEDNKIKSVDLARSRNTILSKTES